MRVKEKKITKIIYINYFIKFNFIYFSERQITY